MVVPMVAVATASLPLAALGYVPAGTAPAPMPNLPR